MPPKSGPGLTKTTAPRLVVRLVRELHRVDALALEALLATADVLTEGACLDGHWLGTTSIEVPLGPALTPPQRRALLADPHLRVRLVRLATREAAFRAPRTLGTTRAEVTLGIVGDLLRIVVDVDAALGHAQARRDDGRAPR